MMKLKLDSVLKSINDTFGIFEEETETAPTVETPDPPQPEVKKPQQSHLKEKKTSDKPPEPKPKAEPKPKGEEKPEDEPGEE